MSRFIRMRCGGRALAATLMVAALSAVLHTPAAVANPPNVGVDADQDAAEQDGEVELTFGIVLDEEAIAEGGNGGSSEYVYVPIPHFGSSGDPDDDNGGACMRLDWQRVHRDDAEQARRQGEADYYWNYQHLVGMGELDPTVPCPIDPADSLPPELVETRIRATLNEQLPRPTLELPPGYALTGLRTYLLTGHELTHQLTTTIDLQIVQLDVTISAAGQSVVDWGDGTVATYDHGATHGYPDGPINHVYTHTDTVDITVTDTWTVTYDAGVIAGTFQAPLNPVTLEDIEVQERRAVRTG